MQARNANLLNLFSCAQELSDELAALIREKDEASISAEERAVVVLLDLLNREN